MKKFKTKKSVSSRFKITNPKKGRGTMMRRAVGINHYNAKEDGNIRRGKRSSRVISKHDDDNMRQLMPYNIA